MLAKSKTDIIQLLMNEETQPDLELEEVKERVGRIDKFLETLTQETLVEFLPMTRETGYAAASMMLVFMGLKPAGEVLLENNKVRGNVPQIKANFAGIKSCDCVATDPYAKEKEVKTFVDGIIYRPELVKRAITAVNDILLKLGYSQEALNDPVKLMEDYFSVPRPVPDNFLEGIIFGYPPVDCALYQIHNSENQTEERITALRDWVKSKYPNIEVLNQPRGELIQLATGVLTGWERFADSAELQQERKRQQYLIDRSGIKEVIEKHASRVRLT